MVFFCWEFRIHVYGHTHTDHLQQWDGWPLHARCYQRLRFLSLGIGLYRIQKRSMSHSLAMNDKDELVYFGGSTGGSGITTSIMGLTADVYIPANTRRPPNVFLTLTMLKYFCIYKPWRQSFLSIWNYHKCFSQLFPLHLNIYVIGLRALFFFLI